MKTRIINYTFDKTAKQITFSDFSAITLDAILILVNVTRNVLIYNFADPLLGGSVATNILTLLYDTSAMANTDKLLIYYDDQYAVPALPISATLQNAASANGNGSTLNVSGRASLRLTVTITGTAQVNFEGTEDGTNWFAISSAQNKQIVSTTVASGMFDFNVTNLQLIRARISGVAASPSVTVTAHASPLTQMTHTIQAGDGNLVTFGAQADTAVTDSTTTNTHMAFLKGIVKILANVWDSTNSWLKVLRVKKDAFAAAVSFTITLNSLASSTAGVGRQSTLITGNTAESALIGVTIKTGTTPTVNSFVFVYLIRGDGTINDDNAGANDAGLTVVNASLLGVILINSASTGQTFKMLFDTKFLGSLGPTWGIALVNGSGAALDSSAGGSAEYSLIS